MIGHRNDKRFILDKGLAGQDRGRVSLPVVYIGQILDANAIPVSSAQILPQQVALVPCHHTQPVEAGLKKASMV